MLATIHERQLTYLLEADPWSSQLLLILPSLSLILASKQSRHRQPSCFRLLTLFSGRPMGTLVGHVAPGFAFFFMGLWHLFCHTKHFVQNPNSYTAALWFPTSKIRYIEPALIILVSSMSVAMELFIGPDRHQPFDPDGTIPLNHLQNFEHSSISMTFLTYASFSILFDKIRPTAHYEMTLLLGALAFGQELFLFHLHSADHMGVEGQYHLILQIVIVVSLSTTLLGIPYPSSFLVSFIRSASILFQGIWFVVMGLGLWTPSLIPKGCFQHMEIGHKVVRCADEKSVHRAKSLVNIQFSWYLIFTTVGIMLFYLAMEKSYRSSIKYTSLTKGSPLVEDEEEELPDLESPKKQPLGGATSLVELGARGSSFLER